MGILAAVAIPAYNKYRKNAAQGAFFSTASNIGRAFQACIAVNPFASCDSFGELNLQCNQCIQPIPAGQKAAPNLCVNMEEEVGGEVFRGCITSNASTGSVVVTFNQESCYIDSGADATATPPCTVGAYEATCDSLQIPVCGMYCKCRLWIRKLVQSSKWSMFRSSL